MWYPGKFDVDFHADGQVVLKGTKDLVVSFSCNDITQLLRISAGLSTLKRSQVVACLSKPVTVGKTMHEYIVFQFQTAEVQSVVAPDTTVVHQGTGGMAIVKMLRKLSPCSRSNKTKEFFHDQCAVNSAKNGPEGIDCTLGAAPNRVYLMDGGLLRTPAMLYVPLSDVDKIGINKIGGGRTFMAVVLLDGEAGGHEFDNIDASEEGAFMRYVSEKRINDPKKAVKKSGGSCAGGSSEKSVKAVEEDTDDEEGAEQDDDDDSDDDEDSEDDSDFKDGKSSSEDEGGDDSDGSEGSGHPKDGSEGSGQEEEEEEAKGSAVGVQGEKGQSPIVVDDDSDEEDAGEDDDEDGSDSGDDDESGDDDDAGMQSDASGDHLDASGLDLDAPRAKRAKC